MRKAEKIKIQIADGNVVEAPISYRRESKEPGISESVLTIDFEAFEGQEFKGSDLFDCLQKARLVGEEHGIIFLCIGARKDAYPSGMLRDMSGGNLTFIHQLGKEFNDETHFIFDEAPADKIGTVAEQKQYYRDWAESRPSVADAENPQSDLTGVVTEFDTNDF